MTTCGFGEAEARQAATWMNISDVLDDKVLLARVRQEIHALCGQFTANRESAVSQAASESAPA